MRGMFVVIALLLWGSVVPSSAQGPDAVVRVQVEHAGTPIAAASVVINGVPHETDSSGVITIKVPAGAVEVVVAKEGYASATLSVSVVPGQEQLVEVELEDASFEEIITVSATRTDKRLEDQPMRVEVLPREEIEEKMMMTPGDIVMMLNETGGLRIQATSPALGAASVRIQGLPGRYTRFLSDGLPLFGEVGGIGLLQIPPMDLGQVEVIKGVASSLYGAGAMGGVVNLLSRRPGAEMQRELLINRSMLGATDAVGFYAAPLTEAWGLTLLGSGHWQARSDVDDDGWSDLPRYGRGVFRPRIFWDNKSGSHFFATVGTTIEEREGGTARNITLPRMAEPYLESLDTKRYDAGFVAQTVRGGRVISARAAFAHQHHDHRFGEIVERDRHQTIFAETAVRGTAGRQTWVAGVAFENDRYLPEDLRQFEYSYTTPGIFVQDDVEVTDWLSFSGSARFDHHSEYGSFFSPRLAALLRSGQWNSRVSIGTGFFGPSPITEETEAAGLSRLSIPMPLRPERGRSASLDVTRTAGPFSTTLTLFASRVKDPLQAIREGGIELRNGARPTTNVGAEVLGTWRQEPFAVTATYAFVRAEEFEDGVKQDVALTPQHSAGIVAFWERDDVGRMGAEFYYTGVQRLETNPYAQRSEPYVVLGLLAERHFGRMRVFVNGENLTDVRQSRWQPLLRPDRAPDGRWTVDAWAPLEGRNINAGIRLVF